MRLSAKIAGIEIVGDEVRVALVRTGGKRPVILEAHVARASYAEPEGRFDAMVTAAKEAAAALKSHPSCFILCASSLDGVARILTVPFRGRKRVAAAAPFELEPYLAVPIEQMAVDFTVIREVEGKTETVAVAMRRAALEDQLTILKAAGIDPDGINIDAAGLTALWRAEQPNKVGLSAVLHVREQGAILAVVHEKVLAYLRSIPTSATQFRANPTAAARETHNSLRAFLAGWENGASIQSLSVTGIELSAEEQAAFEEGVPVPVRYEQLAQPLKGVEQLPAPAGEAPVPSDGSEAAPEPGDAEDVDVPSEVVASEQQHNYWEAAIGCAMAAAGGEFNFDFRKGDLSRPGAMRGVVLHAVFSSCLLLAVCAVYVTYCYINYRHNVAETERIGKEAWNAFVAAFPKSPYAKERPQRDVGGVLTMELFNKEMKKLSDAPPTVGLDIFQKPSLLDILVEISKAMPGNEVRVTQLKLTSGRTPHLEIRGEDTDPAAVNAAFEKLKKSKVFQVEGDVHHETTGNKSTFKIMAVP